MAELTTSNSSNIPSTYEADERIAARAALSVADEKWRTLCTQHASTFVAAERRSVAVQSALRELLEKISRAGPTVRRVERALNANNNDDDDDDEDDDDDDNNDDYNNDDYNNQEGEEFKSQPKRRSAASALADLAEKHRLRRRTLMQHSSLLELLELPSLMDACVRSSLYDDALSIAGFANTLERRHLMDGAGTGAAAADAKQQQQQQQQLKQQLNNQEKSHHRGNVVAGVVSEIRRREADLRRQLIHRLRGDVTMPQCLELVTALRRLNGVELERRGNTARINSNSSSSSHTINSNSNNNSNATSRSDPNDLEGVHAAMEMRLQVDFLEARDAWLEGGIARVGSAAAAVSSLGEEGKLLGSSSSSSSRLGGGAGDALGSSTQAEQILDGIERYRTRCFEIVTQFLAIFRGSFAPSTSSSSSSSSTSSNNNDHSFSLLSMWTARRIQTFLTSLNSNVVSHVHDTATLRDALDAASFFASSMGRVGADFQSLLAPIFEPRLTEMVLGHWKDGLNGMVDTLKACRDAGVAGPLFGTETSSGKDGSGGYNNLDHAMEMQSSRTPSPPRNLLALPPLARFLNAYLTGLNELRRCLLPGSFPAIRSAQIKLVSDAKMALQANERAVLTPGLRGEAAKLRDVASRMKSEFEISVGPYMNNCLEVAFGSADYAMLEAEKARALEEAKAAAIAAKTAARHAEEEKARAEEEAKANAKAALEQEKLEEAERKAAEEVANEQQQSGEDENVGEDSVAPIETQQTDEDSDFYDSDE